MKLQGSLIFSNIVTLILALTFGWELREIIWVYFFESLLIGVFTVIRLYLSFKPKPGRTIPSMPGAGPLHLVLPIFFCVHFGFFHLIFYSFLSGKVEAVNPAIVLSGALIFLLEMIVDLIKDIKKSRLVADIAHFFLPYARIFPIAACIMLGVQAGAGEVQPVTLILFVGVKTGAEAYFQYKLFLRRGMPANGA